MMVLRLLKRIVKAILWLVVIVVLIPVLGLAYGFLTTPSLDRSPLPGVADGAPPPALATQLRATIPGYQRPEESTFLTYPEWAIVYAAREYAGFVDKDQPSGFPYFAYIGRFWQDYATVIRASSGHDFNFANHQMLVVIGTSHTIEHALQWAYENTVGRITEAMAGRRTAADIYQARVAADYAAFLDQVPWYQFPYADKRQGLFAVRPAPGDSAVRTSERKLAFGFADTIKQGYADLIKSALAATSDPAALDIHVWAKGPVGEATRGAGRPLFLEISRFVVIGGHLDARQRGFIAVMPGEDGADAIGQARFARLDDVHPAACPLLPPGRIGIGIPRLSRCSLLKRHGPVRPMPDPKSIRGFGFLKTA